MLESIQAFVEYLRPQLISYKPLSNRALKSGGEANLLKSLFKGNNLIKYSGTQDKVLVYLAICQKQEIVRSIINHFILHNNHD